MTSKCKIKRTLFCLNPKPSAPFTIEGLRRKKEQSRTDFVLEPAAVVPPGTVMTERVQTSGPSKKGGLMKYKNTSQHPWVKTTRKNQTE